MVPDSATHVPDPGGAGALLMVVIEVDPEAEAEFNRWYDERHVKQRLEMPGFVSARRLRSTETSGRYLAMYELESPDAALSDEYMTRARSLEDDWDRAVSSQWELRIREVWIDITPDSWDARQ